MRRRRAEVDIVAGRVGRKMDALIIEYWECAIQVEANSSRGCQFDKVMSGRRVES
jgi:hypothetical protein